MKRASGLISVLCLLAVCAPGAQAAEVTLIKSGTILTVTQGTIENGDVLIRDGKIAEVGKGLKAPEGAKVIDATGLFVMPGIIDCHSHIAVAGSVNEGSVSVSSMVNIADVLNPEDIDIYRDLAGGVTTANILHGSANPIGGQTLVIKLRWGKPAKDLPFEGALPGIKWALGENVKRSGFSLPGTSQRYPASRMGVVDVFREAFSEALDYKKAWDDYNRRKAAGEANLIPPRRDLKLEPLLEVLEGKRLVHMHCYRADEILQLIRVAEEFHFKIATFQHVLEGYKVADEIAKSGSGASTFSDWWAYKVEAYDAIPYNAALMTERGIVVSINSDSGEEARHLNQEAAKSMKWGGLSRDEALKLVTINPAIQLHIADRVGSIEAGKDADLAIYNKDPLSVYAVAQKVLIDGQVYFDRQQDLTRRAALEKEKKALLEKESKAAEARRRPGRPGAGPNAAPKSGAPPAGTPKAPRAPGELSSNT
ncbi:MAG: amidohydrolase family protein [Terriglobia bacterium]|jgi:imidazolonepropionase-like amidohydrolase